MPQDSPFDLFSDDPDIDEFDPLADDDPDEDDEDLQDDEFVPETATNVDIPHAPVAPPVDARTAEERTHDLFKSMAPRRKVLLGVLSFCQEPQPVAQVNALVDQLQQHNASVFSPANICTNLEKAGAIERTTRAGVTGEDIEVQPDVVVVDGVEYLKAADPDEVLWQTTKAGLKALEEDKPLERLQQLLDENRRYADIYKRVLELCSTEDGATTPTINAAVNDDPLVQKPRLYAPHFVKQLEKCDALEWRKAWHVTDVGRSALELLGSVGDEREEEGEDHA